MGYRVKSLTATRFRILATQRLKEFIVHGFSMDDFLGMNETHAVLIEQRDEPKITSTGK